MVATYSTDHLKSCAERRMVDFDPNSNIDVLVALDPAGSVNLLPIAVFRRFLAGFTTTVGTGGITAFSIVAAPAVDTAVGACTAVVTHGLGSNPDAVTDYVWLECDADQIKEVLATATHVGVLLNLVTDTDEGKVYFERGDPLYGPRAGLTADYVA
jgi:hypothetical protein